MVRYAYDDDDPAVEQALEGWSTLSDHIPLRKSSKLLKTELASRHHGGGDIVTWDDLRSGMQMMNRDQQLAITYRDDWHAADSRYGSSPRDSTSHVRDFGNRLPLHDIERGSGSGLRRTPSRSVGGSQYGSEPRSSPCRDGEEQKGVMAEWGYGRGPNGYDSAGDHSQRPKLGCSNEALNQASRARTHDQPAPPYAGRIDDAGDDEESSEPSIAEASKKEMTALEFEDEAFARLQARNSDRKLESKAKKAEKAAKTKEENAEKKKAMEQEAAEELAKHTDESHVMKKPACAATKDSVAAPMKRPAAASESEPISKRPAASGTMSDALYVVKWDPTYKAIRRAWVSKHFHAGERASDKLHLSAKVKQLVAAEMAERARNAWDKHH